MGWFRKKRKEIAQEFVEDVKEEVNSQVTEKSSNWIEIALLAAPVVIGIVDHVIGTGKVNAPVVSTRPQHFTLYIDTVNIYTK